MMVEPPPRKTNPLRSENPRSRYRTAQSSTTNMNSNQRNFAVHPSVANIYSPSTTTPTHWSSRRGDHFGGGTLVVAPGFNSFMTKAAIRPEDLPNNSFSHSSPRSISQSSNGQLMQSLLSRPIGPGLLKPRQEWMEWQEVSIRVRRLPMEISTFDLWNAFEKEGPVTFIELDQGRDGQKDGTARVRFMPPPAKDFWSIGHYSLILSESGTSIIVEVSLIPKKKERNWKIQSPVRKHIYYPELLKIFPQEVDFGFMFDPSTMMRMRSAPSKTPKDLIFQVDLLRRKLVIFFPYEFSDPRNRDNPAADRGDLARNSSYMIWIPFEQIEKIYRVDLDDLTTSFILPLDSPPCFFRKRQDMYASHAKEANVWTEMDTWYRQTDIIYDPSTIKRKPISLKKGELEIDIGRWTTYRFVIERTQAANNLNVLHTFQEALKDWNIPTVLFDNFSMVPPVEPKFWSLVEQESLSQSALSLLTGSKNNFHFDFEIRYQLEVCISHGVFLGHNLTANFLSTLAKLAQKSQSRARSILEYFAETDRRVHDPMTIFESKEARARAIRTKIPHYCVYTRKATVTPTGIYFATPSVETSNRVVRQFSEFGDRFLRVQFTDEKFEGRISANVDKIKNDELYSRVYRTLVNGIVIGDRKYEFLAFGNSQFRQNGAYFFCPHERLTCNAIRAWMGRFDHIKVVAKYAARLGQCFSTTRAIHGTKVEIGKIEDIERNSFNFTDGVGKISEFLAQMITTELGLPIAAHVPSAFQFRLGGCKGILVVWPDVTGRQIKIRPSQQKFEAVYNGLEIIRCSKFSTATLNRQTITILSDLGVPNDVFIRMLTKQLSQYQTAMTERSVAMQLLQKWIDENNMTITIASMILNGFMDNREPFLMSLLHLWRAWSIKLLKEKAKLMVEDGAFVFGCVDEAGTLKGHNNDAEPFDKHGNRNVADLPEIFLQVPESGNPTKYRVIQGVCLLGRNPSLHPGDLRVVKAVNVPELAHLRDVVVFPQLGDRDIPSMCSGGDLDGDDFFVIWDTTLIPNEWNIGPMSYNAPPPVEKAKGSVAIEDVMKFFVKFMKNDSLPTIAHAHLAQSDWLEKGVKDRACLRLAELHSKAVDYVKTGEAAVLPKNLRPRRWPHFMDKKYKPKEQIYTSGKVLGLLYDKVESVDFVPQYSESFDRRILKAYNLDSALLKTARQLKTQYDTALKRIMAQMEIETEFEIYTTFILSKPRIGSDYKQQEDMGVVSDSLKDRFRKACMEAANADGIKDFSQIAPFVAAMYKVTQEEMQIALEECRGTKMVGGREVPKRKMSPKFMPLMSFPWIFHEVLGRIAVGKLGIEALEELGISKDLGAIRSGLHARRQRVQGNDTEDDFVETAEGITYRGELLDLFRPDPESDAYDSEEQNEDTVGDDDIDPSLLTRNTPLRNLETESRKLHLVEYIAPHKETNLDDEFAGPALDGFLDPVRAKAYAANADDDPINVGGGEDGSTSSSDDHKAKEVDRVANTPESTSESPFTPTSTTYHSHTDFETDSNFNTNRGGIVPPAPTPTSPRTENEEAVEEEEQEYEEEVIKLEENNPMDKLRWLVQSRGH